MTCSPCGVACRAAGTADRCRNTAPARRGRSRRPRRSPASRPRSGWRAGRRVSVGEVVEHPDQLIHQKASARRRPAPPGRRPRSGGGSRRARAPAPPSAAAAARRGRSPAARDCGNRPRQFVGERPPVDDLALPQDGGHASLASSLSSGRRSPASMRGMCRHARTPLTASPGGEAETVAATAHLAHKCRPASTAMIEPVV